MVDLLRSHDSIALGRERFAWRFYTGDPFRPELFQKERFCRQFSMEDSHHSKLQPYYQDLYDRFDRCTYVGDKIPELYSSYEYVLDVFPGCKIIYMARNIYDVASSFQGRANMTEEILRANQNADVSRMWAVDRNWESAVEEWNDAVSKTAEIIDVAQLFVANYELLYKDIDFLKQVFEFLKLPITGSVERNWRVGADQRRKIESVRGCMLRHDQIETIRRTANVSLFERLLSENSGHMK